MQPNRLTILFVFFSLSVLPLTLSAEDGYRLWLRYESITETEITQAYQSRMQSIHFPGNAPKLNVARDELRRGITKMLQEIPSINRGISGNGALIIGTPESSEIIGSLGLQDEIRNTGNEGYLIREIEYKGNNALVIAASENIGVLYGVFHLLRLMQTRQDLTNVEITESPRIDLRVLNHWDNLDRTVERGYAGFSLWDWHKLPEYIKPRYIDYARANASIGINGTVLTNVNANADVLTSQYLEKVAALADAFRPYGIKVYLTARFSAPTEIDTLKTADPLNENVQKWWKQKANEIYEYIPDFGGFLVKANSEGQPGPQDYNRSHAEGANMLADAIAPHGGVVMWRAFVYSSEVPEDRAKQAYNEFTPLDGKFRDNVLVQVKNGPIDFQPREPFHPLFGAMPDTPLMMEFQITQEYLGQGTHLVYLAPLFKEALYSDTYAKGKGSYVADVVDGSLENHAISGIAGVSNIGTDRNWTSHPFGQANWYAYGRLAWDHNLSSAEIADEWLRMTFTNDTDFITPVKKMMLASREITVNYMTPLGLHHIMGWGHHYGPAPWIKQGRPDWTSVYYHRADSIGIGFDRTSTGSNAVSQYYPPVTEKFEDPETCPEKYLLWFHHLPWDYTTNSGRTLWDELVHRYYSGADSVQWMQKTWQSMAGLIDTQRFNKVTTYLEIQHQEALWWRNACLLYFQTFSDRPIPDGYPQPEKSLDYYKNLQFKYAPGH
ncbi:MAG: alpha-glucuronidase [Candidatus Marinimicrobia bacterium]|nr:alpha-glucuronidase [Candidatus Neomarinimicrobiota bacterium]MCF7827616.1 alpha-glucuronidase [Candidatus Neomarinimicrobiota bacterium]MCF7881329.1 alpha-glucuronidase [Candidatus Neomarinimicrobiota bacterium]